MSIASASIITGILSALLDKKGTPGSIGKMFCGIFLAITMIRPLADISFDAVTDWINSYEVEAGFIVSEGEALTSVSTQSIIKSRCEAYIQDKGREMDLELTAQISLDDHCPYAPVSVTVTGPVPPHKKTILENRIIQDLAIPKEQIQWK